MSCFRRYFSKHSADKLCQLPVFCFQSNQMWLDGPQMKFICGATSHYSAFDVAQLSEPPAAITIDNWEPESSDWIRFEQHVNLLPARSGWSRFNELSFCPQNVSTSSRRRPLSVSREEEDDVSRASCHNKDARSNRQSLLRRVWSFSVVFLMNINWNAALAVLMCCQIKLIDTFDRNLSLVRTRRAIFILSKSIVSGFQ